jgi:hypothetical protein
MTPIDKLTAGLALLALCATAAAQDTGERTTVSFSDPSRPGMLHVRLVQGSITVKGADLKQVIIATHGGHGGWPIPEPEAPPGLHRIPQQTSITVEEQNNQMSIASPYPGYMLALEIQVPRRTNLQLSTINGGDIRVEGVDGELELSNVNGAIFLTQVSGSVVAHTVNGSVTATVARANPQNPMAFTSLNGTVDVTLPATVHANLKLRSDRGNVYTGFDLATLSQSAPQVEDTRGSGGRYRVEVNKGIYGSVNGGGTEIELRTFNGDVYLRKGG